MHRFELLQLCKNLVFCFVRQMALYSDAAKIAPSDSDEPKGSSDRRSTEHHDLFSQEQINETFQVVSSWMSNHHGIPKDMDLLGKEIKVA